ncbi:hypothetical protein HBB16_11625 [Pseudonocardia sp. MCCB 268]|nr:hypothetical protein [Pseudonocardia cytotoxica]
MRLPRVSAPPAAPYLFTGPAPRTFTDEPVTDETLRSVWELAVAADRGQRTRKPLRVTTVRRRRRNRLLPLLAEGNRPSRGRAGRLAGRGPGLPRARPVTFDQAGSGRPRGAEPGRPAPA